MLLAALDYSLSCPCMCLSTDPGFQNARWWYLTDVKKSVGKFHDGQIIGKLHTEWLTPEERYENISCFFIEVLESQRVGAGIPVFIEDYSFGSKGKVFHIAENTGLVKWKIWSRGHDITPVAPTVIKKFATTKGNAKKEQMYEAFLKATSVDFTALGKVGGSPVSDIVDAYWLAQYGHSEVAKRRMENE